MLWCPVILHRGGPVVNRKKTIIKLVERITRSWLEEDYSALSACLDEDVVMCLPAALPHSVGRDEVCRTFRRLHAGRTIKKYDQAESFVNVIGNRSVACYLYRMDYEEGDSQCSELGADFYVFEHKEKGWLLRWRSVYAMENGSNDASDAIPN